MKNIVIFGGGTQLGIIIDLISKNKEYNIVGIIDSVASVGDVLFQYEPKNCGCLVSYTCIGKQEDIIKIINDYNIIGGCISVGSNYNRYKIYTEIEERLLKAENFNFEWVNLIHPSCQIAENVKFGKGIVAMSGCSFEVNSKIGDFTAFYTQAKVQHDNIISDFASISSGVTLGGKVYIGKYSAICLGVTVFDRVNIPENTIVGSGSLVTKSLESNSLYYGNPCKFIRSRKLTDKYLK